MRPGDASELLWVRVTFTVTGMARGLEALCVDVHVACGFELLILLFDSRQEFLGLGTVSVRQYSLYETVTTLGL